MNTYPTIFIWVSLTAGRLVHDYRNAPGTGQQRSRGGPPVIPLTDSPPRRTFPWVTVAIIVVNVLVFLYELTLPNSQLEILVQSAGTIPAEILTGRDLPPPAPIPGVVWITLFTAMFVHGGFLHIASNMLYLWVFGDNVEVTFGHGTYLVFYLVVGVLAGMTHVFVNVGSDVPSVGASGAIAGVLGAYLLLFPNAQVRTLIFLGPFITWALGNNSR